MVFQNEQDVARTSYPRRNKSPFFSFRNSATIATTLTYLFDYHRDNLRTEKYGSFNNLSITNNSDEDIIVYPNQNKNEGGIIIPGNTEKSFDQRFFPSTTSLLIENVGSGTIAINGVRVSIWKDRTEIQTIASNIHERIFSDEPNPFIKDFSQVLLNMRKKL